MTTNNNPTTKHDAMVDREAWKLLLSYVESGLEADVGRDEDDEFDEATYEEITKKAWDLLWKMQSEHVSDTAEQDT